MKVTVTFADTAVVVPCKAGWTVWDLVEQATRRYRRILEQHGERAVKTHHLEYAEGGILDMDDMLSDLVDDRDKLVAVFSEVQHRRTDSPRENKSSYSSAAPSPEPLRYYPHMQFQEPTRGEIEVNEAILKANTPLLVRSSSDSALAPPHEKTATPPPDHHSNASPEPEINHVLKGALDRLTTDNPPAKMSPVNFGTLTRTVEFLGDRGPLGIHVVPYCSSLSGRTLGLHIRGIEENSRSKRENIFQEDECIVQINDTPLQDKTFTQSQEVFRQAMTSSAICLEVLPVANKLRYEKSLIGHLFTGDGKDSSSAKAKSPMVVRAKADSQPEPRPDSKLNTKLEVRRPDTRAKTPEPAAVNTPSAEIQSGHGSLERVSPAPPARGASSSPTRSQSPLASRSPALPGLANLTSKKGGKRIKIDLKKGAEGLGFTVVTRDSSAHAPGPILVKNILPRGAAVNDGRLQPGDRILEVNGVDMTGRSQEELVGMLRSTKQGENVCVVVARQEDIFLPRELKGEDSNSVVLEDGREQLMYEIPLNETGSAGLGVSLKGNKSRETGEDLGIFIKSIIHGGAAHKDGRLSINDQMIAVNGESLLGRSNHAAMETLRRSMSSEGNARGTIQLVVLRAPRQTQQMASANPAASTATNVSNSHQSNPQASSSNQEPRGHDAYQKPSGASRPPNTESSANAASHIPMTANNYTHGNSRNALYPAATTNGSYGHYGNEDEELEEGFPPPPSPGAVEEMNRNLPTIPPHHSEFQMSPHMAAAFYSQLADDEDNVPRNRASKSMDMVADESNVGSLVGQRNEPSAGGALGPTLGLWKSSSLESLQTAVSEAKQSHSQAQVPFHRPRPHMVRGRGCNQSFRIAIDKSYDGPSEDDDDLSEQSSGHETPASSSSRQGLDADDGKKKKKPKDRKKDKKIKGKKKTDDSVEDLDKKTKKKGFGLLRFGKKKEDKSKEAAKASKNKLEALSEEEVDRDGYDPRYTEIHSGHVTPDSLPDVEDDDSDPNYARINNFRQPPSPQSFISRTPSPAATTAGHHLPQASSEELDGLYAKVNKPRHPAAVQSQHHTQADSDPRYQGLRKEYQPPRAAPVYEELDAARRRVLENDPHRMAPRGGESRPAHRYEEADRQYHTHPRRDPYDYPTHSRPMPRESAPYPIHYQDPLISSHPGRVQSGTHSQQASSNPRYYPSSPHMGLQHRTMVRQDVPPSPPAGHRGRHYYEAAGGRAGRYTSPERQPVSGERYTSPERYAYRDERQPNPRRKNPVIGAV
ncbi:partitioning defective 3 homolog B-like isoform X1 [Seriola lalandi dorsalis]|uniref:partitioning defective 3 homolog B-like isoform X1 n=2 Tax=Seriola lalandi dorsalis TaxID=1841481 RepID=UPI000C6F67E6|nr:partitioning defective 3 homolog B-like isoform X1 [Seriola lalandi dorsalis]